MAFVDDTDPRLSDARTPLPHKASHSTGGSDALTPANIGAEAVAKKGQPNGYAALDSNGRLIVSQLPVGGGTTVLSWNGQTGNISATPETLGAIPVGALDDYTTSAELEQLLDGKLSINDPKTTDARTPKPHSASHASGASDAIIPSSIGAVATNDGRLTDARTPRAHHASHATGGSDPITPTSIGAVATTDSRLNDTRTPKNHAASHAFGAADVITPAAIHAVSTSDARLTDARTPTPHANTHAAGAADQITPVSIGAATAASLNNYQLKSAKGASNGYAGLDSSGRVPLSQLPTSASNPVITINGLAGPNPVLNASAVGAVDASDSRLTNARTPTAHANSHHTGGTDPLTAASIGGVASASVGQANGVAALDSSGKVPTAQLPSSVATSGVLSVNGDDGPDVSLVVADIPGAVATTDNRLTNARQPTAHASTHATGGTDELTPDAIGAASASLIGQPSGLATLDSFGKIPNANSQVASNDTRLTNARTPTSHAGTHATGGSDAITPASIGAATTGAISNLESKANKGVANGYASLNSSGLVPTAQLPTTMTPTAHAASHATGGSDAITPASIGAAKITDLAVFEIQSNKGAANGYASLGATGQVPGNQLPATMTPSAHAASHAIGGADLLTPAAIGAATTASLGAYQLAAQKGAANGFASLDATAKVPVAQLPNNQVLVLSASAPVPSGTPANTVIFRTAT